MRSGCALIDFGTVEFVDAPKARQTIAYIRTDRIFAHRIRMAMVAKLVTLFGTLVNICVECKNWSRTIAIENQIKTIRTLII